VRPGEPAPGEISALLLRMRGGDVHARDELVPLVYRDLEAIARAYVRSPDRSIEPQGLVHELYLRLADGALDARDRKHFFAVAALAMRQILVDRARRRRAAKRGGDAVQVTLTGLASDEEPIDLLAVDDALRRLEELSPRQARIVELRCLVGLTTQEIADALSVSERTVQGEWRLARAWLTRALGGA
jgi:RNA polymerase sigma factor (TIGR02999 family)